MQKLTPTPEQEQAIKDMINARAGINASDPGTGKTLMGVEVILRSWSTRSLVIAPHATWDNWRDTILAQSEGTEVLLPCSNSKIAEDTTVKECKANLEALLRGDDGHYFIGREFFVTLDWETVPDVDKKGKQKTRKVVDPKTKQPVIDPETGKQKEIPLTKRVQKRIWEKHPFDVILFDESHVAANQNSKGYLTWLRAASDHKFALSGTFYGNQWENCWAATNAVFGDAVTDTYWLWQGRYCETKYDHFAPRHIKVVGEKNPGEYVNSLPCYIQLRADTSNPVPTIRWVDLYKEQRKTYTDLVDNMVTFINDNPLVVELSITQRTRLRQVTLGELTFDEDGEINFDPNGKSAKRDELISELKEFPDNPVVIATDSARYAAVLTDQLNKHFKGTVAGLWAGQTRTSTAQRDQVKADFLSGKLKYIVGVIKAMGTGVDGLQEVCSDMIVMSEQEGDDSTMEQLYRRLARKGQKKPVRIVTIAARNTHDDGTMNGLIAQALRNNRSRLKESLDKEVVHA